MKIVIDQSLEYDDIELIIKCPSIDERIEKIISQINKEYSVLKGRIKDRTYAIQISDVFYIESIDEKTFAYKENQVLELNEKLYELEEVLQGSNFIRISKSCILNLDKLESVKYLLNGKYEAILENQEVVVISRHYVPAFKKKFGL